MRVFLWTVVQTLSSTVALSGCSQSAKGADTTAAAVIERLYQNDSWETGDSIPVDRRPLFAAPAETLRRYLDSAFVRAVLADRACQVRTQDVCNLDFDPVWDSQDPTGATVHVVPTPDSSIVQARIGYPGANETRVVTYRMRRVGKGWRIADMGGGDWPSLLEMLDSRQGKTSR